MDKKEKAPFSYPVKVGHISANPVVVTLKANAEELHNLATLWGVDAVKSLEAELHLARWKKDGVRLKGEVHADIVQSCVVTLEPVEASINEHVEQLFVPEGSRLARQVFNESGEMVLDPEGDDLPESFEGDTIDAGVAVCEFVALAIDPYPRKPGVAFDAHIEDDGEGEGKPNPFAVLKNLKKD